MGKLQKMLQDDMDTTSIGGSNFSFSAQKLDKLGASEYTLVVVAIDVSGSLYGYESGLENMLTMIVEACANDQNPRCDNMMLRVVLFNEEVEELHGFVQVRDINPDDYKGKISVGGLTAARDAAYSGAKSCTEFAETLMGQQCSANAALFLVTDGMDNESSASENMLKEALVEGQQKEVLESMMPVLIGIGTGATEDEADMNVYLKELKDNAGFQQYEYAGKCTPESLARVAKFVSASATSQSQNLGSGGPSASLAF